MNNFCSLESQDIDQKIILVKNINFKREVKNIKLIEHKTDLISNDISNNIKNELSNISNDLKPVNIIAPLLFLTHINILFSKIK